MEKVSYCRFCNEKHIVSETRDSEGSVVGMFCNREKALITAHTSHWNGEDILPAIERFVNFHVDFEVLPRVKGEGLNGLSKKLAYQILQSNYAKKQKWNYYFVLHHALDTLRAIKQRLYYARLQ